MDLRPLKKNILPDPPSSVRKMIGPSIVLVGLGLGTGELILCPYLTANWGLGIIWGALLGITIQFFLNMEIERYTLANGESIFVGFARLFKYIPIWFIGSTVLAWSWPAFAVTSANMLKPFGLENPTYVSLGILLIVGLILTLGPVLYKTVETFQKILVLTSIPLILLVAFYVVKFVHIKMMFLGLVGIGEGFRFIPLVDAFPLMGFLGAFAYSGAGGNLMLAQSFYIKEKGYAMGKYSGRITSLITGKDEQVDLQGTTFEPKTEEISKFQRWWKLANLEHFIVFWGIGLFTMLLLSVIAYASVYGRAGNAEGINFYFTQAEVIKQMGGPWVGAAMLIIGSSMLFSTQLAITDAAARIVTENVMLISRRDANSRKVRKTYYSSVWIILLFGMTVILAGLNEPQFLIVLGAVLNAVCMVVFAAILVKTNKRLLPTPAQPPLWRQIIVYVSFVILFIFCTLVLLDNLTPFDVVKTVKAILYKG